MNINLKISVSDNSVQQDKVNLIYELSNQLNSHFHDYNYGDDVKRIDIGFLIILERPGYEDWYKPKGIKYVKYKKKINLAGETIIIEKTLSYEIKLSDEQLYKFTGGNDELSKNVLATEIISSLSNFDKLPKEVKDFSAEKFKTDLHRFFKAPN